MDYAHTIQQILVDENAVATGDFSYDITGKVVDLLVECKDDSGYSLIVGFNEGSATGKDVLIPGKGKTYGVPERGFLDGNKLYLNFSATGVGAKRALVTIWRQGQQIC